MSTSVLCPRCRAEEFTPYDAPWTDGAPARPALSRLDNATYICSSCGTAEAMRDFTGRGPIPPAEWPVVA